ncbi:MAG: hypothetical protein RMI78_02325 [Nitrososphaerota archaeon]|nr:hypothetical protein [Nitrososphaerota archaeon]
MTGKPSEIIFRRLQRVGKATYAISLPKRWVVDRGLKPGDALEISEELDGSLCIKPLETRPRLFPCRINAELCRSSEQLARLITACYRAGYDSIEISFTGMATPEALKSVKKTVTEALPGFDIIEETGSKLIIQNILDHSKYQLDDLLRRIHLITSTIFSNLMDFVTTRRYELIPYIADLRKRALEILQLHSRLLISYFKRQETGRFLKPRSGAHIYSAILVAHIFRGVIDDLTLFAEEVSKMRKRIWANPEIYRVLSYSLESASKLFDDTLTAYFSINFERATHVLSVSEDVFSTVIEDAIHEKTIKDPALNRFLTRSVIFLRDLTRKCREIAQLTLDMFVELENPILQRT